MNKEDIQTLKEINSILNPSMWANAVYVDPAQAMRDSADALDRENETKRKFNDLLQRLENKD